MRRLSLALGTAAVVAGLAGFLAPALVAGFSLPAPLLLAVGLLALFEAVFAVSERVNTGREADPLPAVEERHVAAVPGDDFDDLLGTVTGRGRVGGAYDRDRVRDRLERVAVETLVRYDGLSRDDARDRLTAGTWTDDRRAAAFFMPPSQVRPSLSDRVRLTMTSDVAFRWQARQVIAALAERVEGER